jgi:hypothetical protein
MKTCINYALFRLFGIKPKQNTLKLELKVGKTVANYEHSLPFNEQFQHIYKQIK